MTIKKATVLRNYPREKDIIRWSTERGIMDNSSRYAQYQKLEEEFEELGEGLENRSREEIMDAIGDMYVCLTNISAMTGLSMDECVEHAWNEIKDRKGHMDENGFFVKEG